MSTFAPLIATITRHRGVSACLVVAEDDGIVVDGTAQIGVSTNAFAALTASLYRKAGKASAAAGFGAVSYFELEAEDGRVLAAGRNGLVIVAVGEAREADILSGGCAVVVQSRSITFYCTCHRAFITERVHREQVIQNQPNRVGCAILDLVT